MKCKVQHLNKGGGLHRIAVVFMKKIWVFLYMTDYIGTSRVVQLPIQPMRF